jgi:hypothetical protein
VTDVPDADPTARTGEPTTAHRDPEQVMDLLADHVPLALLMDLVTPEGPASADILRAEGMPDDAWWEPDDAVEVTGEDGTERPADELPGA